LEGWVEGKGREGKKESCFVYSEREVFNFLRKKERREMDA
jgi:hypothetical protein